MEPNPRSAGVPWQTDRGADGRGLVPGPSSCAHLHIQQQPGASAYATKRSHAIWEQQARPRHGGSHPRMPPTLGLTRGFAGREAPLTTRPSPLPRALTFMAGVPPPAGAGAGQPQIGTTRSGSPRGAHRLAPTDDHPVKGTGIWLPRRSHSINCVDSNANQASCSTRVCATVSTARDSDPRASRKGAYRLTQRPWHVETIVNC
jgi:hypothetical protein